jgi:hypothetical protein
MQESIKPRQVILLETKQRITNTFNPRDPKTKTKLLNLWFSSTPEGIRETF